MAEGITKLADDTERLAANLAKSQKSSEAMSFSFIKMAGALGAGELLKEQVASMLKQSATYVKFQQYTSAENLNVNGLLKKRSGLEDDLLRYQQRNANLGRQNSQGYKDTLAAKRAELVTLEKHLDFAEKVAKVSKASLVVTGMAVAAGRELWINQRSFNQNLIEANSSWQHRGELMGYTLMLQTQMGISFEQVTRSAAALVHYSMDTEVSFEKNLRLVSQMEQGLGVSVQESAKLASIVERQLKGSFEGVANTISQIVNDTALAGDEAARLATNISLALGRLRPGMSAASLPDVLRLVGRYEGALKEIGGQSGAFQQLLTQMTTPEGIVGAGALGVNPEFLATEQGIKTVMDRFAQYGQSLVGNAQGWDRQWRLMALAQVFNTSADQANQMLMAIKRANDQQGKAITAQDRWREQMNATDQGITRLKNSLTGMLQTAMWPVVWAVGALANKLADLLEKVTSVKEVAIGLSAVMGIGILGAFGRLVSGIAPLLTRILPGSAAATATGWVARIASPLLGILRYLTGPIGIGFALIAYRIGQIYSVNKESAELQRAQRQIILSQQEKYTSNMKARFYAGARSGDVTEALAAYQALARDIISRAGTTSSGRAKAKSELELLLSESGLDLLKATVTRGMFTELSKRTLEEVDKEKELTDLTEKMYEVNQKALTQHQLRVSQEWQKMQNAENQEGKESLLNLWHESIGEKPFRAWRRNP